MMNSRNKTDVKKLFEYYCEVTRTHGGIDHASTARYNGGPVTPVGIITESFPENFRDEKTIGNIPAFAFPCDFDSQSVQSYSFVLTTDDSKWRFGFCRHDPKTESTMVLITLLPWHDTFLRMLAVLAEIRRTDETKKEFKQFLNEAYNRGVPDVGSQLKLVYSQGQSQFIFERPQPFQLPSIPENHNLNLYYNFVDPKNMIAVFAAMLAERRIIFTSRRLDRLSSCIQAANAFLYPMVWQHIFIPVLPMKLKDYLSAPMPYLIGVPQMVLDTMLPEELGEVVILNCDTKIFESPFDDVHSMPTEIVSYLKKELSRTNQLMGDRVSKIFLRVLVRLIGGYRDAVEFRDTGKTFNRDKFIESRSSNLRPFLTKMMELQIFQQFIDERLEMMKNGLGFSDEFEEETALYAEEIKKRSGFYHQLKEKTNPAVKSAVKSVKESSRAAKHAYKDIKSKIRDGTSSPQQHGAHTQFRSHLTSNSQHDRMDGVAVKGFGRHSAPSSPVFSKRIGVVGTATGFQYASKEEINGGPKHLRHNVSRAGATIPLAMSSSSSHIQSNGYAKNITGPFNHHTRLASSPTVSPASSLCSSEMNLSQELQNHPLFKTPPVDRTLKPSLSSETSGGHRITASRTGGPPRPPPPAAHLLQIYQQQQQLPQSKHTYNPPPTYYNQPYGAGQQHNDRLEYPYAEGRPPPIPRPAPLNFQKTLSLNSTASKKHLLSTQSSLPASARSATLSNNTFCSSSSSTCSSSSSSSLHASMPNHNKNYLQTTTTDSTYDTPPDMLSPPVPPRKQASSLTLNFNSSSSSSAASTPTTPCNEGDGNALSDAVAATAAAVTAGITRLERNCWQDYGENQLLKNTSLRSSTSSTSNKSNTSSSSSASFVTAASCFSLYQQSSPPGTAAATEPPIPAPRLKKDKESLHSLPQHLTMGGLKTNGMNSNNSNASDESMKDLISLDDSHNNSFDLEDFDPLNQNARPLPSIAKLNAVAAAAAANKAKTLPANVTNPASLMMMNNSSNNSISNPTYNIYMPKHLQPPSEKPPPLPKSIPPPLPPPDEDFELLRKYGLDQFSLITAAVTSTSNSAATITAASSTKTNGLTTSSGMQNWTTFD